MQRNATKQIHLTRTSISLGVSMVVSRMVGVYEGMRPRRCRDQSIDAIEDHRVARSPRRFSFALPTETTASFSRAQLAVDSTLADPIGWRLHERKPESMVRSCPSRFRRSSSSSYALSMALNKFSWGISRVGPVPHQDHFPRACHQQHPRAPPRTTSGFTFRC
jgi:hypothetical protein